MFDEHFYTGPIGRDAPSKPKANAKPAKPKKRVVRRPVQRQAQVAVAKKPSRWVWILERTATLALLAGNVLAVAEMALFLLRPDLFAPVLALLGGLLALTLYTGLRALYASQVAAKTLRS